MTEQSKPVPETGSPREPEQLPPVTFTNSLRAWQARYRARLAVQVSVLGKVDNPVAPA